MLDSGYKSLSVRKVAAACDTAVGTIYNYFPSKEYLAASIILEDWLIDVAMIEKNIAQAINRMEGIRSIFDGISAFYTKYRHFFSESGIAPAGSSYPDRHQTLRRQVEDLIKKAFRIDGLSAEDFQCTFLAETLLTASREELDFNQMSKILNKLI